MANNTTTRLLTLPGRMLSMWDARQDTAQIAAALSVEEAEVVRTLMPLLERRRQAGTLPDRFD